MIQFDKIITEKFKLRSQGSRSAISTNTSTKVILSRIVLFLNPRLKNVLNFVNFIGAQFFDKFF